MILKVIGLILSFSLLGASQAQALNRYEELNQLYDVYRQRFDSQGRYHADKKKAQIFTQAQDAFVAKMKTTGAIKEILLAENDFIQKLWVRLYVLQDETGNLMAFFWEQGDYQDDEVRSYIRFRALPEVEKGLPFVPVLDTHAIVVKGFYMTPDKGGTLRVTYLQNIRDNETAFLDLFLLKKDNQWGLQTQQLQPVAKVLIDIWTQLLPPNGGVRAVVFK